MTKKTVEAASVTTTPTKAKKATTNQRPPFGATPPARTSRTRDAATLDWDAFRETLINRRKAIRWRQDDVARRASIGKSTYGMHENGRANFYPSDRQREAISEALGFTADSLDRVLRGEKPIEVRSVDDMRIEGRAMAAGLGKLTKDEFQLDLETIRLRDPEGYDALVRRVRRLAEALKEE